MSLLKQPYEVLRELFNDSQMTLKEQNEFIPMESALTNLNPSEKRSVEQVFQERSSVRFFDTESDVLQEDLRAVLHEMFQYAEKNWPNAMDGLSFEAMVFPERVTNMDSRSIYLASGKHPAYLEKIAQLPDNVRKRDIVLQEEFASAAVIVVLVGNLPRALEQYQGSNGHRKLLLRAGAMGHYAWLQCLSRGYEGTVFAGILPKMLRSFCDIDGYRKCQLFAFAFGTSAFSSAKVEA